MPKKNKKKAKKFEGKYASDGTSIVANLREDEEEEQNKTFIRQQVHNYVNVNVEDAGSFRDVVSQQSHFIMTFNILCHTSEYFVPLEIGLVAYSIQDGIKKTYHKFIDPGRIPTGYHGQAKDHSESSHGLLFADIQKEDQYVNIWNEITNFMDVSADDELPPIFTVYECVPQTSSCLSWLSHQAGIELYPEDFHMWELPYLLYEMCAGLKGSLPSDLMAIDLLSGASFDYTIGINCKFHEDADSRYCALGIAQRQCFMLSDAVGGRFKIELTTNHMPNMAGEFKLYQVCPPPPPTQSKPEGNALRSARVTDDQCDKSTYDSLDDFTDELPMGIGRGVRSITEQLGHVKINFDPSKGVGRGLPVPK